MNLFELSIVNYFEDSEFLDWAFGKGNRKNMIPEWNRRRGDILMINEDFCYSDIKKMKEAFLNHKKDLDERSKRDNG